MDEENNEESRGYQTGIKDAKRKMQKERKKKERAQTAKTFWNKLPTKVKLIILGIGAGAIVLIILLASFVNYLNVLEERKKDEERIAKNNAFSYDGNYVVHTEMPNTAPVLNEKELLVIINNYFKRLDHSEHAIQNLKEALPGFMKIQNTYKVNAVFAFAVVYNESAAGTSDDEVQKHAADLKETFNWFSIMKGGWDGEYVTDEAGNKWLKFKSFSDATIGFGKVIARNPGLYFSDEKYDVNSISKNYCETSEYWAQCINQTMTDMYKSAGIDIDSDEYYGDYSGESNVPYNGTYSQNVLRACREVMLDLLAAGATYDGQLFKNNIEATNNFKNNPHCVCATYVTVVLYRAGALSKEFINSTKYNYNYTGTRYKNGIPEMMKDAGWRRVDINSIMPGDVCAYNEINGESGHVWIYAGNGYIYDQSCGVISSTSSGNRAPKRDAFQSSQCGFHGTWGNSRFEYWIWRKP